VKSIRGLQSFEGLGYLYAPERSTPHQPVFIRDNT
ncbi:MAG: peroxide stress protein YaaA, partial [Actinomycetia bacterium]|nr:peroxide stress protein YaaA [Actinomycetes bacterium]